MVTSLWEVGRQRKKGLDQMGVVFWVVSVISVPFRAFALSIERRRVFNV